MLPFQIGNLVLIYLISLKVYDRPSALRCAVFYACLFVPLFTWLGWFDGFPPLFPAAGALSDHDRPASVGRSRHRHWLHDKAHAHPARAGGVAGVSASQAPILDLCWDHAGDDFGYRRPLSAHQG